MADYKFVDINYKLNTYNKDLKLAYESEAINNSIRNILTTLKGTLPGNPNFGTNLEEALFEIIDEITLSFIEDIILVELEKQEPRIIVKRINFDVKEDENQIFTTILYEIINTSEIESTLVKISI